MTDRVEIIEKLAAVLDAGLEDALWTRVRELTRGGPANFSDRYPQLRGRIFRLSKLAGNLFAESPARWTTAAEQVVLPQTRDGAVIKAIDELFESLQGEGAA